MKQDGYEGYGIFCLKLILALGLNSFVDGKGLL